MASLSWPRGWGRRPLSAGDLIDPSSTGTRNPMFEKILVPLDRTELSEGILPCVSQLAKGLKAPVVLLSVIDPGSVSEQLVGNFEHAGGLHTPPTFERLKKEAMARLEEGAKRLDDERAVTTRCVVSVGEPAEEIVRVAEGEGCDLIAMATHGRSSLWRTIRGSVTDRVIRSANVPTLAVAQKRADGNRREGAIISKVLVALDGSRLAETALPYVEHLARNLSLEVVLVQAMEPGMQYLSLRVIEACEKLTAEYLKGIAEKLQAGGLKVRWQHLHGSAAASLVDLARETPGNIIVLATHGRSGLRRWIAGSVADAVVRASGNPVLVIRPRHSV